MTSSSFQLPSHTSETWKVVPAAEDNFKLDYVTLKISEIYDAVSFRNFLQTILNPSKLKISKRPAKRHIGYDYAYQIIVVDRHNSTVSCGKFAYSKSYNRAIVELTGVACDYIASTSRDYSILASLVQLPHVKISRCDIALDDVNGLFNVTKIDKSYSVGKFDPVVGKRPVKKNLGSKLSGRTRYIGGKTAYRSLCVYEKGLQLKIPKLSNWIRFEVRFRANTRDTIPAEVLSNREAFFLNAFPKFFKKIHADIPPISIVERRAIEYQSALSSKIKTGQHFSGRLINVLRQQLDDSDVVNVLARSGVPKGLLLPQFVTDEDLSLTQRFLVLES